MKKTIKAMRVEAMELIPGPEDAGEQFCGSFLVLKETRGERRIKLPLIKEEAKIISLIRNKIFSWSSSENSIKSNILNSFGEELTKLIITNSRDGIYQGLAVFRRDGEDISINLRPFLVSIAIDLEKPIYVSEELLAEPGESGSGQGEKVFKFLFEIKRD